MPEFPDLHGFYEATFAETHADPVVEKHVDLLDNFFMYWSGCFIHAMEHDLRRKFDLDQNVLIAFFASQTMVFDWMAFSAKCGHYTLVFRECRTILESTMLLSGIESNMPQASLSDKLDRWTDLEAGHKSYGKRVFRKSGLKNWEAYYNLYKRLCGYTHASVGLTGHEVRHMALRGGQSLDFSYSQDKFLQCFDVWYDVAQTASDAAETMYQTLGVTPEMFDPNLFKDQRADIAA
jgi:hypothetical protein